MLRLLRSCLGIAYAIGLATFSQNVAALDSDHRHSPQAKADTPHHQLALTRQEQAWLQAHPVIRVGVTRDFPPYEWIDEKGQYVGPVAEYMRLLEKRLGVQFKIIHDRPWSDILEMAKNGELDLLSCVNKTPERSRFLSFTEPYKSTHIVIIDNGQSGYLSGVEQLHGKRVSVEKDYFMQEFMLTNHPEIKVVPAADTLKALDLVVSGGADAYVGDAGTANYFIRKGALFSLRFTGQTEYDSQYRLATNKKTPELSAILDKAMATIPKEESEAIFNHWLGLKIERGVSTETLAKYGAATLILFAAIMFWALRLNREISNRKNSEALLRASEAHLKAILESTSECVKLVSRDGTLITMNRAGLDLIEAGSADDVVCKSVYPLIAPEYRDDFQKFHQEICDGRSGTLEFEIIGLNGTRKWMETHAVPFTSAQYPESIQLAFTQEITHRKRTEIALQEAESNMRVLFNSTPVGVVVADQETKEFIYANSAFCDLLGYSNEEALNLTVFDIHPESAMDRVLNEFETLARGEKQFVTDIPVKRKNGSIFLVEIHADHKMEFKGRRVLLGIFTDISERKKVEELQKKIDIENALVESAESLQQSIGHELHDNLGQILSGISLFCKALQEQLIQDDNRYSQLADSIVMHSNAAIRECKSLSSNLAPLHLESNDLDSALHSLALRTQSVFDVDVEIDCAINVQIESAETALHIYRIVQEAMSNAIRHGGARSITVSLSIDPGNICLSIKDDGAGLGRLNMPSGTSSGMGLKIMKYRASKIGADIQFRPQKEGGSEILVETV